MNRTVFTLATVMILLFFLLTNYDRFFFAVHFLEATIYLVVLLLLFYGIEDWAYGIGTLAPLFWIVLALLSGPLHLGLRALGKLVTFQGVENPVNFLSGLIFLGALALTISCGRSFYRNIWGTQGAWRTALLSVVVVGVYYAVLVAALLRLARPAS